MSYFYRKALTKEERDSIVNKLLENSSIGKLKHSSMKTHVRKFEVSKKIILRTWHDKKEAACSPTGAADVSCRKKENSGKKENDRNESINRVESVSLNNRCTIRMLSSGIRIHASTL